MTVLPPSRKPPAKPPGYMKTANKKACLPSQNRQKPLSDYEKRVPHLERCMAQLRKIIFDTPGLTTSEIGARFLHTYGFLPTIDNKLRANRKRGYIKSEKGKDGLLHWFPVEGY